MPEMALEEVKQFRDTFILSIYTGMQAYKKQLQKFSNLSSPMLQPERSITFHCFVVLAKRL